MDHRHEYGASCEHCEHLMSRMEELEFRLMYVLDILNTNLHAVGEHVERIEEEEAASNEEPSSHEEEPAEEHEEELADEEPEVVITDDTELPDLPLPTEENHRRLPMMG